MPVGTSRAALRLAAALALVAVGAIGGAGFSRTAVAQAASKSLEAGGNENELRMRKNMWTIGIAGGPLSGSNMTFADELAQVLDDGDNLRILPIATHGWAANLEDLLYLRDVDVAVTQSDAFDTFRTQHKTPNLEARINYIVRLPLAEMHVLAHSDIASLADLRRKKVNFGPAGGASSLTGTIVFQRAGVQVEPTNFDDSIALQKLKAGEIAALVLVSGKPIDFFAKIPQNSGLHLVPIAFDTTTYSLYTLGEFTSEEYPTLVPPGQSIDTIGVPSVLAVVNSPKNSDRYRRVQRFVEALFTKFDQFQQPPRHPKWRDVNLAATVPGWTRWSGAEDMLQKIRQASLQADAHPVTQGAGADAVPTATPEFAAFLKTKAVAGVEFSPEERDALFREFLVWEQRRVGVRPR